ncbi:hypothetical protein P3L10_028713 [Capsicum annuum]
MMKEIFCTYNISTYGSVKEHAIIVKRPVTQVSCSCKIFEFMGILCRYALKILDILNVKDTIPAYYILKRWTKDVTNMHEMDINLVTKDSNPKVEVIARVWQKKAFLHGAFHNYLKDYPIIPMEV